MGLKTLTRGLTAAALVAGATAVTTATTTTAAHACSATARYVNVNSATRGITRLYLIRRCHGHRAVYYVKMYGKCHPRDCSWKLVRIARRGGSRVFIGYTNHGFAKRRILIRHVGRGRMILRIYTNFVDPNRRDYVSTHRLRRV